MSFRLRKHRHLTHLTFLVFVASLSISLVASEILLRAIGRPPRTFPPIGLFEPDARLGYRLRANFSGSYVKDGQRFSVETNASGFRDRRVFQDAEPGVRRILAVGDSFVFGMPVEAEETFVAVLEQELNRRAAGDTWQVLNLGVPSYATAQERLLLEDWAPRLQPESVLLTFYAGNDFHDNLLPPEAPAYRIHGGIQVTPEAAAAAAQGAFGELLFQLRLQSSRLALFDFARFRLAALKSTLFGSGGDEAREWDPTAPDVWTATVRALDEVISFARTEQLRFIVLLIPEKRVVLSNSARNPAREKLYAHLNELGVQVLDPTVELQAQAQRVPLFERHGSHFSAAGNALLGRFLASRVLAPQPTGDSGRLILENAP